MSDNDKEASASGADGQEIYAALPLIRSLADMLAETGLTELEIERDGLRIRLSGRRKTSVVSASDSAPVPVEPVVEASASGDDWSSHPGVVKSPMVGTVYLAPEPGAPAYVRCDDYVSEGQTLLVVEAMKTFNAVTAPQSGRLKRIIAEDGKPVEYGEPLLIIE